MRSDRDEPEERPENTYIHGPRLKNTSIGEYVAPRPGARRTAAGWQSDMERAAEAFERETAEAMSLSPIGTSGFWERHESVRPFILKVLLFVGVRPVGQNFIALARIIETLAMHPEVKPTKAVGDMAKVMGTDYTTLTRMIENTFNVYDEKFMESVTYLTDTHPFSSRDALNDLALYVRTKFQGSY